GGALEIILKRLADFKEKAQSLKRKITGAMVYPVVVIVVAVGILTFIMLAIIPKFEKIFKDFNMELPDMTKALMATSRWFSEYWYTLPLFPLGLWLLIKLIRLSKSGNYAVDRVYLWIPIIGPLIEKTIIARTTRTLGTLVASGVPILEALSIVRETCTNAVFERMYHRVSDDDDVFAVTPAAFRAQMETLRESGVTVVPLSDALGLLERQVDGRYVCITFDDG